MKVAVALSGGIDSSFACLSLLKKGFKVGGFTLKIPFLNNDCIKRAEYLSGKLNIPHKVIDVTPFFNKKVIDCFLDSYLSGLTPNPCCLCNPNIKFGILRLKAQKLGYSHFATGHYARIIKEGNKFYLAKARNNKKSQEYFLGLLPKSTLKTLIFPLADYTKEEVRNKIREEGIYPFKLRESQEICFITDNNYKKFIESKIANTHKYYGLIKYRDGKVLGRHKGIYSFTYGQREGLGISWKRPLYVLSINPKTKDVIVGEKEFVFKDKFIVAGLNWFYPKDDYDNIKVKLRYNGRSLACRIERIDDKRIECAFKSIKDIPTPGQLAVFYDKEKIMAAGFIEREKF